MEKLTASRLQNFDSLLKKMISFSDELPAAVIIHRTSDMQIIHMNKTGLDVLGLSLDELKQLSNEEYYGRYFNPEDSKDYVPKILHLIHSKVDITVNYFQQVRDPKTMEWLLYVSNTKVFSRDEAGEVSHLVTIASKIDPVHHISSKVNRMMDELNFYRTNTPLFNTLTKREKEILHRVALGLNSVEVADQLFISPATVDTHRKNLRTKLQLKNYYDVLRFAQAYNLL